MCRVAVPKPGFIKQGRVGTELRRCRSAGTVNALTMQRCGARTPGHVRSSVRGWRQVAEAAWSLPLAWHGARSIAVPHALATMRPSPHAYAPDSGTSGARTTGPVASRRSVRPACPACRACSRLRIASVSVAARLVSRRAAAHSGPRPGLRGQLRFAWPSVGRANRRRKKIRRSPPRTAMNGGQVPAASSAGAHPADDRHAGYAWAGVRSMSGNHAEAVAWRSASAAICGFL